MKGSVQRTETVTLRSEGQAPKQPQGTFNVTEFLACAFLTLSTGVVAGACWYGVHIHGPIADDGLITSVCGVIGGFATLMFAGCCIGGVETFYWRPARVKK
jgi:hypothetical protein